MNLQVTNRSYPHKCPAPRPVARRPTGSRFSVLKQANKRVALRPPRLRVLAPLPLAPRPVLAVSVRVRSAVSHQLQVPVRAAVLVLWLSNNAKNQKTLRIIAYRAPLKVARIRARISKKIRKINHPLSDCHSSLQNPLPNKVHGKPFLVYVAG